MTRGYHMLRCPYCEKADRYWVSPREGVNGASCRHCDKWFHYAVELTTVKRENAMGEKSPAWKAAVKLVSWVPEGTRPSDYAEWSGYAVEDAKQDDGAPFVSETFLYHLLGKMDARTFLALFRQLLEVMGISLREVERAAARKNGSNIVEQHG